MRSLTAVEMAAAMSTQRNGRAEIAPMIIRPCSTEWFARGGFLYRVNPRQSPMVTRTGNDHGVVSARTI